MWIVSLSAHRGKNIGTIPEVYIVQKFPTGRSFVTLVYSANMYYISGVGYQTSESGESNLGPQRFRVLSAARDLRSLKVE